MKKSALLVCISLLLSTLLLSCADTKTPADDPGAEDTFEKVGKIFYVSPDGNDEADGSDASPFATLEGAKNAVRALKTGEGLPDGGVTVYFKSGTYPVNSTLEFTAEDSGEARKPIIYTKAKDAEVIFDGGVSIDPSAFVPASDDIKARIQNPEAAEALLEVDLNAVGCYDLDDSAEYTSGWITYFYRQDLYVDDQRQKLARWPNSGFTASVHSYYEEGLGSEFTIPEEKAQLWKDSDSIQYFGYPVYDWSSVRALHKYVTVDAERSLLIVDKQDYGAPTNFSKFYVFNVLEEIDEPGEYFWDVPENKLYYYPDGSLDGRKISFSQFAGSWFLLADASHLTFDGFTFENGRSAVFGSKSADLYCDRITVRNCKFQCMSANAAYFNGNNVEFLSNELCELGGGGVSVVGGSLKTSEGSNSLVCNNYIHDWSQIYTICNQGIHVVGCGFHVCHNELCNSPHEAIGFDCSDALIEYNYIHDVCDQTSDAGALYSGRRWDWRGNIVRYNFIMNVIDKYNGGSPNAIYLDDMIAGQEIYGNLIVNTGGSAIALCGGRELTAYNNVIIGSGSYPMSAGDRGLNWAGYHITYPGEMWALLNAAGITSKIHIYRFPANLIMIEDGDGSSGNNADDPGTPSNITCTRNVSYACKLKHFVMTDNMIDASDAALAYGTFTNNLGYEADEDPGFVDAENGDYHFREDARVFRDIVGFEPIPIDDIGRFEIN